MIDVRSSTKLSTCASFDAQWYFHVSSKPKVKMTAVSSIAVQGCREFSEEDGGSSGDVGGVVIETGQLEDMAAGETGENDFSGAAAGGGSSVGLDAAGGSVGKAP